MRFVHVLEMRDGKVQCLRTYATEDGPEQPWGCGSRCRGRMWRSIEPTEGAPMQAVRREDVPVAIAGDGVEFRKQEIGGDLTVAFVHVPKGADFRPALAGLEGDLCQCPHWGYMINGRVKMHTSDGEHVYEAGQAFYWAPGHAPEALEDSDYVDFSPTGELNEVIDHITSQGASE
jgi:hypothetical protein